MKRGHKSIVARAAADFRAEPGSKVGLDLDLKKAVFFDLATGRNLVG